MKVIAVEREYGAGGPAIAEELARRLNWKLWDEELTEEIARRLKCASSDVERREEKLDPTYYRLAKIFMRGSYQSSFANSNIDMLDAEGLAKLFEEVVVEIASRGNCVIMGRAAPWFLRGRPDVFSIFIYAPRDYKIQRVVKQGKTEKEAADLVDNVDNDRAAFIKRYHNKEWPKRDLYHLMINSVVGSKLVVDVVLGEMEVLRRAAGPQRTEALESPDRRSA